MTRKTKLYKATVENKDVYFRTLTVNELSFLNNIKNEAERYNQSCKISVIDYNWEDVPWQARLDIGREALIYSTRTINNQQLHEITIKEFRNDVKNDATIWCIDKIRQVFPGQSLTDLLDLTVDDLLELVCFCEEVTGKQIFEVGSFTGKRKKILNPQEMADKGKSLREKIKGIQIPK